MKNNPHASSTDPLISQQPEANFESAFARLETILEQMNSGSISLDESLKLFEEADKLIVTCNKKLTEAERRIETLIKNRNGDLTLSQDQRPMTQDFHPTHSSNSK